MFKTKNLLVIKLSQTGIQCISVKGNSTEKNILIESISTITFDQPELESNHIFQTVFIIKTIQKHHCHHDVIAWILDETLVKSYIVDPSKELPKNDISSATMQYYRNDNADLYCDTMSQALLLQIRLIAYSLQSYCLSPVTHFNVLSHVYYKHLFNKENKKQNTLSIQTLKDFFNYTTVKKILPFQKNIAQQNYQTYILMYGLLSMYLKQWNNDER